MQSPFDAWISTCRFGVEAQQVIATRLLRSMRCDAAASVEAARMVNEKVAAFIESHAAAGLAFATGKTLLVDRGGRSAAASASDRQCGLQPSISFARSAHTQRRSSLE